MISVRKINKKTTLLGYELKMHHDALLNYLIPSLFSCLLYILLISTDIAVVFRHYKDNNPIWAGLSIFFMYLPALSCYIYTISCWDLWPEPENCNQRNIKWFLLKTVQHLLFPIWSMWRYAERIFWSIEALLNKDNEKKQDEAMLAVSAPRTIELYSFLQSYLHCLPQILLQLHILMRNQSDMEKQTIEALIMSVAYNLTKISVTTAYYQRFKTQKLAGRQYPWYKSYRNYNGPSFTNDEVNLLRNPSSLLNRSIIEIRPNTSSLEKSYKLEPSIVQERRRSSDIYLEPTNSFRESFPNPFNSVLQDPSHNSKKTSNDYLEPLGFFPDSFRNPDNPTLEDPSNNSRGSHDTYLEPNSFFREFVPNPSNPALQDLSLTYPRRTSYANLVPITFFPDSSPNPTTPTLQDPANNSVQTGGTSSRNQLNFDIKRIVYTKGLLEDDLAGKMISFFWWFCFLLARFLAISTFTYFYQMPSIWIISAHFLLILLVLSYDVKTDHLNRGKIVFFLFLAFIYLFIIIEFKIKFKKTKFIYYGFFGLVFSENFVMCLIWWFRNVEDLQNDFWFRYIFYLIVMCSIISCSSMIFYLNINKPKKIVVNTRLV